ncbi:MAG: hypothetical protein HY763_01825 [Planctomycetes bacterium]|nr:hypothetical protein [Planctomycetota bacterium]
MPAPKEFLASVVTDFPAAAALKSRAATLDRELGRKALMDRLVGAGFRPVATGKDAYFGVTNKYTANNGKKVTVECVMQSYRKTGSRDAAAVGTVTVKADQETETYRFSLVAPDGDFDRMVEHTVDKNNKVRPAHSWFSCIKNCFKKKCVGACLTALTTCSGTVAAYFWCVVARCGGCGLGCLGCCACDCRWWCKWAIGCCDR